MNEPVAAPAITGGGWAPKLPRWLQGSNGRVAMSHDKAQRAAKVLLRSSGYLLPVALVSGALVRALAFWRGVERARALAAGGRPFERRSSSSGKVILILGDSTGVGVGAQCPEESIAGRLAVDFPDADIVNVSRSGARVCDTVEQARECVSLGLRFDFAVLHVGGNDVVRATAIDRLATDCDALLAELKRVADCTVWLGPANVGLAPLFPLPYSWILAARSRAASSVFSASAVRHGVAFVDFCAPEHSVLLRRSPRSHFAADGFHPSSSTYGHGYSALRTAMALAAPLAAALPAVALPAA
jgi:lysophospholipase L1-like esterase